MANTSATGGYLVPDPSSLPGDDIALAKAIQGFVAGVTGLPGTHVVQRWQAKGPPQFDLNVNWCGVGVGNSTPEGPASLRKTSPDDGQVLISTRYYILGVVASFYGPQAGAYADILENGMQIAQNREELIYTNGLNFVDFGQRIHIPDRPNNLWRNRYDITFRLRRRVEYTYPIRRFKTVQGTFNTDVGLTKPFQVDFEV